MLRYLTTLLMIASIAGTMASAQETAVVETKDGAASVVVSSEATSEKKQPIKKKKPVKLADFTLAKGTLRLQLPESWKAVKVRSRIIEKEFAVPKVKDDKNDGRLTMMRSGGSLELNINRWFGQFTQPDGKKTKDVAKVVSKNIHGQKVTIVDIPGTFTESMGGGPFAPGKKIKREGYRMFGGIVQTKVSGQYFFKLYGPQETMKAANEHFMKMMESVQSVDKRSD